MNKTERVFFPGCSLPSYNPQLVEKTLSYLQEKLPNLGSIQKCCGKPTKALGQMDLFKERYDGVQKDIDALGAEEVIVACQNCYLTMKANSPNQKITSLWTLLPEIGLPEEVIGIGRDSDITFAVQDSCSTREEKDIHDGVRWVIDRLGYKVEEMEYTRGMTRCCGFGGMALPANPELSKRVMARRAQEASTDYMVTYCAACRMSMALGGKKALHLLDLVWGGPWTSESEFPAAGASALTSWGNRFRSKRSIKKVLQTV